MITFYVLQDSPAAEAKPIWNLMPAEVACPLRFKGHWLSAMSCGKSSALPGISVNYWVCEWGWGNDLDFHGYLWLYISASSEVLFTVLVVVVVSLVLLSIQIWNAAPSFNPHAYSKTTAKIML